ncbi:MAG: hypothetical protein QOG67_2317 [Verrucomicrobiota bacterium]
MRRRVSFLRGGTAFPYNLRLGTIPLLLTLQNFTESKHNRNQIATRSVQPHCMDIDALHSTLLSITLVSDKLRFTRELFAETKETGDELERSLHEIETDLRVAKATLAGELGLTLCSQCWPPELVTTDMAGRRVGCPVCGQIAYDKAA